jgi:hypothetical protein
MTLTYLRYHLLRGVPHWRLSYFRRAILIPNLILWYKIVFYYIYHDMQYTVVVLFKFYLCFWLRNKTDMRGVFLVILPLVYIFLYYFLWLFCSINCRYIYINIMILRYLYVLIVQIIVTRVWYYRYGHF